MDIITYLNKAGFYQADISSPEARMQANHSNNEYSVSYVNNHLSISSDKEKRQSRITKISSGALTYIGRNRGEWGGDLMVTYSDQTQDVLISENIVSMFVYQNDLYVFTGLAHMSFDRGAVYKVSDIQSNPVAEKVATLPQATHAVLLDESNVQAPRFVIVTTSGVTLYYPDHNEVHVLDETLFWGNLYPDSIERVTDNQYIIAMRSGVALIRLDELTVLEVTYYKK